MCDYREINARTRRDAYPLPRIDETLDALSGAQWFSTLDLASGYNQVPMAEPDKEKTAFCTPFGLFEFNRMPFGLLFGPCLLCSGGGSLASPVPGDDSCNYSPFQAYYRNKRLIQIVILVVLLLFIS